jgi:GT2 family glycosyltransferase
VAPVSAPSGGRLSVVVVIWNEGPEVVDSLGPLGEQLGEGDELIVIDNASSTGVPALIAERVPGARVIRNEENLGFAPACNGGAEAARGELIVLLNPDASPGPGFAAAIRRPIVEGRGWAGWMGLVTSDGGRTLNTDGNLVHFTGFSWAGGAGLPADRAAREPGEVASLSGACLAIPRSTWRELGGFPPEYFIYNEDLDISMRLRLRGGRLGLEPGAVVDHAYEFGKGKEKWRRLERNRWAVIIRTYPAPLLVLLLPALLLTELALIPIAIAGGWGTRKLRAMLDVLVWLPRLLRERGAVQSERTITSADFAAWLTPDLSSRYFGRAAESRLLRWGLRAYWWVVLTLLRARPRPELRRQAP